MRILSLEYHDKLRDWRLERMTFDKLTLLVGASGVGKTRILNCLETLKSIAEGHYFYGSSWNIEFTTVDEKAYRWRGEFEVLELDREAFTADAPRLFKRDPRRLPKQSPDDFRAHHESRT